MKERKKDLKNERKKERSLEWKKERQTERERDRDRECVCERERERERERDKKCSKTPIYESSSFIYFTNLDLKNRKNEKNENY